MKGPEGKNRNFPSVRRYVVRQQRTERASEHTHPFRPLCMLTKRRFLSRSSDSPFPTTERAALRAGGKKPGASRAHLSGEHEKGGELLMSSDIMDGLELVGPRSSSDVKDQSKGRRNSYIVRVE